MRKALAIAVLLGVICVGSVIAAPRLLATSDPTADSAAGRGSHALAISHASPLRAAAESSQPGNPFSQHVLPAEQRRWIRGSVVGRLEAGSYVYLRLRELDGAETWLVSLALATPRRERVRALVLGRAERFHSRRLERDFSPLLFAAVRGDEP